MPFEGKSPEFLRPAKKEEQELCQVNLSLTRKQNFLLTKFASEQNKSKSSLAREVFKWALSRLQEEEG